MRKNEEGDFLVELFAAPSSGKLFLETTGDTLWFGDKMGSASTILAGFAEGLDAWEVGHNGTAWWCYVPASGAESVGSVTISL